MHAHKPLHTPVTLLFSGYMHTHTSTARGAGCPIGAQNASSKRLNLLLSDWRWTCLTCQCAGGILKNGQPDLHTAGLQKPQAPFVAASWRLSVNNIVMDVCVIHLQGLLTGLTILPQSPKYDTCKSNWQQTGSLHLSGVIQLRGTQRWPDSNNQFGVMLVLQPGALITSWEDAAPAPFQNNGILAPDGLSGTVWWWKSCSLSCYQNPSGLL